MLEKLFSFLSLLGPTLAGMLVGIVLACVVIFAGLFLASRIVDGFFGLDTQLPRMCHWGVISILLLMAIGLLAPQNLTVIIYKICLVTLGAVLAYYIDRALFPYARPHRYSTCNDWKPAPPHEIPLFAASMLRRSLIVLACILGLTLGL